MGTNGKSRWLERALSYLNKTVSSFDLPVGSGEYLPITCHVMAWDEQRPRGVESTRPGSSS